MEQIGGSSPEKRQPKLHFTAAASVNFLDDSGNPQRAKDTAARIALRSQRLVFAHYREMAACCQ
jgi:hypothetical protein